MYIMYCAIQNSDTPLHFAALNGHEEIVWHLIDSDADVNATNLVSLITR